MPEQIQYFFILTLSIFLLTSCENIIDESLALEANSEGLILLNKGKTTQAVSKFKEALEAENITKDTKVAILRNIAICYYENDQIDSSIYFSRQAVTFCKKESYDYYINQSDVNLLESEVDEAIKNLKRARRINPEDLEVNNSLGLIFLGEYGEEYADYERALFFNEKVVAISKDRPTLTVLARNYYHLKRYEEAEKLFTELYDQYPELLNYQYWIGITKFDNGEVEAATAMLEDLVMKDSAYSDLVWFLYE